MLTAVAVGMAAFAIISCLAIGYACLRMSSRFEERISELENPVGGSPVIVKYQQEKGEEKVIPYYTMQMSTADAWAWEQESQGVHIDPAEVENQKRLWMEEGI